MIGVEYCTGYVDDRGIWNKGFYCPKKGDGVTSLEHKSKDIFCCGSHTNKYCCERKEGFTTSTSGFYVSFSTLVSVTTVTFILAVLLTAIAFICCRRYWKDRDRNLEIHETHFYRMACSSSNAPLVSSSSVSASTPYSASFQPNPATISFPTDLSTAPSSLINTYSHHRPHQAVAAYPLSIREHRLVHSRSSNSTGLLLQDGAMTHHQLITDHPAYPPPPYRSHTSVAHLTTVTTPITANDSEEGDNDTDHHHNNEHHNHHNSGDHMNHNQNNHHHQNNHLHHDHEGNLNNLSIVSRNNMKKPLWRKLSQ